MSQAPILAKEGDIKTPEKLDGAELEVQYPTIPGAPELTEKPLLPEYILYIYYFAIVASGFVAFGAALYGGVRYLTSGGNPTTRHAARGYIFGGILGIFILLLSYIILTTINPQFAFLEIKLPPSLGVFVPKPSQQGTPCTTNTGIQGIWEEDKNGNLVCVIKTEGFQEVPLGTLAEEVLDQNKIEKLLAFMAGVEERSQAVKNAAGGLNGLKEALEKCSCGGLAPASCSLAGNSCTSSGACTGDPCPNRNEIEEKTAKLMEAQTELNNFVFANLAEIEKYGVDIANLAKGAAMLKEGVLPINYDNFLELRDILGDFAEVKTDPFPGFAGPVEAAGYDSMNFYLDKVSNQSVLEKFAEGEFSLAPLLPPGTMGNPPPKNPGALTWPFPTGIITGHFGCNPPDYHFKTCAAAFPSCATSHCGVDVSNRKADNHPIYAAADGKVLGTGYCGGNWIMIWHKDLGLSTLYGHLMTGSIRVKAGDSVTQSEQIAREDSTGFVTGEHLHFEVYNGKGLIRKGCPSGELLNPCDYAPCPN